MRPHHTQHSLSGFPVHSATFVAPNDIVIGGGGGSSKSGVKNKLRLYSIGSDRSMILKNEIDVEDAPTSMAVDLEAGTGHFEWRDDTNLAKLSKIICGINSPPAKIQQGENVNCRLFGLNDDVFHPDKSISTLPPDEDDYQVQFYCFTKIRELNRSQKVTVLSPKGDLVAVAGCHNLSLLSFPSLIPAACSVQLEKEIYDATFSSTGETFVVATTHSLHVYSTKMLAMSAPSRKSKDKNNTFMMEKTESLELLQTIDLPNSIGGPGVCTFRSVRYHPCNDDVVYTVINASLPRGRGRKAPARRGYILKWNTQTWTVEKHKKVGDKGLTAFDISLDGRFLGYGSSDLSIGILDTKTLTPLCTILKAHEFPPTTVKFDPTTKLIASGSADSTFRIIAIPEVIGGFSWTVIILALMGILVVIIAVVMQDKQLVW